MNRSDATPSPSEMLLARLLAELDQTPTPARAAVIDRYLRENPEQASTIRAVVDADAGVRPVKSDAETASRRLQAGQRLGPFRIIRFVAQGGMGEVYEAVQDVLDRRVALKVIRNGFVSSIARARFLREQQVLAKLHQTNIVPVHHAGDEGDLQYCAMQFVDGASLHKVVTELYRRGTSEAGSRQTPPIREVVGSLLRSVPDIPSADSTAVTAEWAAATFPMGSRIPPSAPLTLSPSYYSSVAAVMIQVAEAVQHGHDRHICHRDIKPSNLMIDSDETCWVIDYGLASAVNGAPVAEPVIVGDPKLTQGPLGTPQYMAPEQFEGKTDARSDVWSLGVTLYELLTLRPAFHGDGWAATKELVTRTEPDDPRALVGNVPADMSAICCKAMAKDPANRYPTAQAFADDLRRWSHWEPTKARPGWRTLRPLRLWAWRKKGYFATAAAVFVTLVCAFGLATALLVKTQRELVDLVKQKEREQAALKSQEIRLGERTGGWSREAMKLLEDLNALSPGDDFRDHAAATLIGLDTQFLLPRTNLTHGTSSVVFDPKGRGLVAGGAGAGPAQLWDGKGTSTLEAGKHAGTGPVAFRSDGTPLQVLLPTAKRSSLLLCNPRKSEPLAEIPLPQKAQPNDAALSIDGSLLAVSFAASDESKNPFAWRPGTIVVWKLSAGPKLSVKQVHEWPIAATALAFSPDNKYLALGTNEGAVSVRGLADGREAVGFRDSRLPVYSLVFGRNFWIGDGEPEAKTTNLAKWLLAVGSKGGGLSVWKLDPLLRVNAFRGHHFDLAAAAFSPDGATLASTARAYPILWDVATGRMLLKPQLGRNYNTGIAFSPSGQQLAITSITLGGSSGGVDVYTLDESRGIRTFRGLSAQIVKVWQSPTSRFVAALAHNWQLGVWEAATGRLLYILDVPTGWSADNAALVFGKDEAEVVFSTGMTAVRWELTSGRRLNTWKLPFTGLVDRLATLPNGNWFLFRAEIERPGGPGPWICRARELKPDNTFTDLYPLNEFSRGVALAELSTDGKLLLVRGASKTGRLFKLYDAVAGKELQVPGLPKVAEQGDMLLNASGTRLMVTTSTGPGRFDYIELPTGKNLGNYLEQGSVLDDAGRLLAEFKSGIALRRLGFEEPFIRLDLGTTLHSNTESPFSRDSRFFAWGRTDGTVCVADLEEVMKRVAQFAKP
jgi:serine/threonine protein kinase/WD40 repeat protein